MDIQMFFSATMLTLLREIRISRLKIKGYMISV